MGKLFGGKSFALQVLSLIPGFAPTRVEWILRVRQPTRDNAVQSIAGQYAREQVETDGKWGSNGRWG